MSYSYSLTWNGSLTWLPEVANVLTFSIDACVKMTLVKVEVLIQLLYASNSKKVQALKCI